MISNLKTPRSRPKKASIRKILTWGCFVKNSLFDSLFPMNLMLSLGFSVVFWKATMYGFICWKKGVWNNFQMIWDSFQTSHLMLKNFPFIVSGTLACVRRPMYAYACMRHVHAALGNACAYTCMRMHALGFLGLNFLEIDCFFSSLKSYIFPKTLSSSQFQSDWALDQP